MACHALDRASGELNVAGSGTSVGQPIPWLLASGGQAAVAHGPDGEKIALTYDGRRRVVERRIERDGFRPRTWRYDWNCHGRLSRCITPTGEIWRYAYDAFGRRVWKAKDLTGPERRYYAIRHPELFDVALLADSGDMTTAQKSRLDRDDDTGKLGGPPTVGTSYFWDGDLVAEEAPLKLDGTTDWSEAERWFYEPESFTPLAKETADGAILWVIADHVGTPRELVDDKGAPVWAADYNTWGGLRRLWTAGDDRDARDAPRASLPRAERTFGALAIAHEAEAIEAARKCCIRFQGQWADEDAQLSYNRYRYYDAQTGQYASPDPIGLRGGMRPHGYVDQPTRFVDPLGLAYTPPPAPGRPTPGNTGGQFQPGQGSVHYKYHPECNCKGWKDKKGHVWEPTDHNGTHAPHWDVQNPSTGNHTPVYPSK